MDAELMSALARIEEKIDALATKPRAATSPTTVPADTGAVADDKELDGKYGDPELKKSPPRWQGRDLAGKRYSQLTAEELECLIGFLVWKAEKNATEGGKNAAKYAGYAVKDAARARGWLKRVREGRVTADAFPDDDSNCPF